MAKLASWYRESFCFALYSNTKASPFRERYPWDENFGQVAV
jgi:hypothetical protein